MAGTEYLVAARQIVPDAKRVLLTAYADTEAAIAAINEVALDYYLLKPWDPPEEQLFPVVEDLLTTWEAGAALNAGGVRIIGHRFSKDSHDLRDFLARNRRAVAVARHRTRRRGPRAADRRRRRARRPAGRAARGRNGARAPDGARAGRAARRRSGAGVRALRPGDRRRRSRRAGGGRLRRVGGAAHGDGRARGAGRPGRAVEPDRELPRLSDGAQRIGPRAPRDRPGPAPGRRAADRQRRGRPARRRGRADGRAERRRRAQRDVRDRRLGRLLPPDDGAGLRRAGRAPASTTAPRCSRRGRASSSTSSSSAAPTRPARRPSTSAAMRRR